MPSIRWTSNLDPSDKPEFEQKLSNSRFVLKRLRDLLEEDLTVSVRDMRNANNFELAAWAEKQAFELGYQKAIITTLQLLKG